MIKRMEWFVYCIFIWILSFRSQGLLYNFQKWKKIPKHTGFIFHSQELLLLIHHGRLYHLIESIIQIGNVVSLYDKDGIPT